MWIWRVEAWSNIAHRSGARWSCHQPLARVWARAGAAQSWCPIMWCMGMDTTLCGAGGCPLYIAWTRRHTNVPKLIIDKTPTFTTFVVYPLFIHALYKTERLQIFGMCWNESQFVSIWNKNVFLVQKNEAFYASLFTTQRRAEVMMTKL